MLTQTLPGLTTTFDLRAFTSGPLDAQIMVVGEAWGYEEEKAKIPFVGESGKELKRIIRDAGLNPNELLFANVVNARPPGNDLSKWTTNATMGKKISGWHFVKGLYVNQAINDNVKRLYQLIEYVKPKLIIACGNWALWALTDNYSIGKAKGVMFPTGIMTWRGSQLRSTIPNGTKGTPVLPVIHPAAILRQWELRQLAVHDIGMRSPLALDGRWDHPTYKFLVRPTADQVVSVLRDWQTSCKRVSCDIETVGGNINCIGFARSHTEAVCIPFLELEGTTLRPYYSTTDYLRVANAIREFLSSGIEIVGQNFMYDIQYLQKFLFVSPAKVNVVDDTLLMQHVCWPTLRKSLDFLSSLYCAHHLYWKEDRKEWHKGDNLESLWSYNCVDCVRTLEIRDELSDLIKTKNLTDQYAFQMEQWYMAVEMMNRGMAINEQERFKMKMELTSAMNEITSYLKEIVPKWMVAEKSKTEWYRSPAQQKELFYGRLGCKVQLNRKTGAASLDTESLTTLKGKYPLFSPIFDKLETLRSVGVFLNTFLSTALDQGRIKCSYNVGGTTTFRWSSSASAFGIGTNLQNIPKGDE